MIFQRHFFPTLSLILFLGSSLSAQQAEICNAALAHGIRDNHYTLASSDQYEEYRNRLCSFDFSSYESFRDSTASLGLNLTAAESLLGLSGDQQTRSQQFSKSYSSYCNSTYLQVDYQQRFVSIISRVSEALQTSWLECQRVHAETWLAANGYGVFLSAVPQDNYSEFTLFVDRRTAHKGSITISEISPQGLNCSREGAALELGSEIESRQLVFSCWKNPNRPIQVTMETSDGVTNTVRVPAQVSAVQELNDRFNSVVTNLSHENSQLRGEIDVLQGQLSRIGLGAGPTALDNTHNRGNGYNIARDCPAGQYVSGISAFDGNKGGPCHNCMTGIIVRCRSFR